MRTVGNFAFVPGRDGDIGDIPRQARAVLEALGYAILVVAGKLPAALKASGGGTRSECWLEALSTVLGLEIHAQDMCWEAAGTADIAARSAWKNPAQRSWKRAPVTTGTGRELVDENLMRATELYQMNGWI